MYDELYHHGIKGQKWGVRRFQKKDGTLTPEGKKQDRSRDSERKPNAKLQKAIDVGLSVSFGLSTTYLGYVGVKHLTHNPTIANMVATSVGTIGGMKYYELMRQRNERLE